MQHKIFVIRRMTLCETLPIMKVLVLYLMVLLNIQIALFQELSAPSIHASQVENDENHNTDKSTTKDFYFKGDEIHDPVENKDHHSEYLSAPISSTDEEMNSDVSYPFKVLLRLIKVKGGITDGVKGASKIFDGVHDVGGELFGMVKDGALNVGSYLPFK